MTLTVDLSESTLARLLFRTPLVRYIAPQIVAFGFWRVHVDPAENRPRPRS
jgi:hypothetical protein